MGNAAFPPSSVLSMGAVGFQKSSGSGDGVFASVNELIWRHHRGEGGGEPRRIPSSSAAEVLFWRPGGAKVVRT